MFTQYVSVARHRARNVYKVPVNEPFVRRPLERASCLLDNNIDIKMRSNGICNFVP